MFKKTKVSLVIYFGLILLGAFFLIKPVKNSSPEKEDEKIVEDLFIEGAVSTSKKFLFNNKKKIVVEQKIDLVGSLANVSIVVKDNHGNIIPNLSVIVYDDQHNSIYDYPILKSDDSGRVGFTLNRDQKFSLIISTIKRQSNNGPSFYFIAQLELDTFKNRKEVVKVSLFELNIFFKNWRKYFSKFPSVKLEAVVVGELGVSQSFEFASNDGGENDKINFFVSRGTYRFNVDAMSFDDKNPISIIAQANDMSVPRSNKIEVDFNLFETYVQRAGVGYGWIKYQNPTFFYGDHQSPFFPENNTLLISNLKKLKQGMVYISPDECITRMLGNDIATLQALVLCRYANIRFDFSNVLDLNQSDISISAPEKLLLHPDQVEVVKGDNLKINYQILNGSGVEIISLYIHQLWDSQILPQFFFYDENGILVYKKDLFDENYTPHKHPYFMEKICLDSGRYLVKAELPMPLWGEKRKLIGSFELVVGPGEDCSYQDEKINNQNFRYQSWKQLYEDRRSLFKKSSGYLLTLPSFSSERLVEINSSKKQARVSGCEDFPLASQAEVIWISLNKEMVFAEDNHKIFSECLIDFSQKNPNKNYVLVNDFWDEKSYPTSNLYIMYYFYQLIHQGSGAEVGVLATQFYDLFYGFPDFAVANPQSLTIIGEKNNDEFKSTLTEWLERYGDISPKRIIYASNF